MGFFDLLDLSSPETRPILNFLPALVSRFMTSPKAVEHDVSFDLTTSPIRQVALRRPHRPSSVRLPLEVVLSIIEAAYYDNNQPDESLLKQCSLVCRAWSGPAQKLLFSHVTLRTETACDSFRDAVDRSTARGRGLGDAVTRLRVVMDHNQPFGITQHSFGDAVTLCPNLYELNLALYGCAAPGEDVVGVPDVSRMRRPAPSFDETTLTLLRSGPKISALQFSNWSENQYSITQLLDVWPSLKSLAISGTPPQPPSPVLEPFACSLEELRMNFQTPPSLEFVSWLLHNSSETLRVLEFEREPSTQLLEHLINEHHSTLVSLSLPSCPSSDLAAAVQKCRQLKDLRVEHQSVTPKLFRDLPESLEHIALGLNRNTHLQPVIDTVRSTESIKVLTLNISDGGDQHPLFPVLKMACAYQGVDMRIVRDIKMFRSMMRGDPVPTSSFPRFQSLDNLYVMRS
ncbi:hypothetical protein Hypma_016112 [Hypsizygus marmoreus]|uniref:F-box domain-containing protein n=1 Tax=Hypsizygus marmoreus TaxID=39966 RepID=A0A369KCX1_HYPMA|nr:hypothetical protein Hypma_016112 [Hypsizygus marmoreus]